MDNNNNNNTSITCLDAAQVAILTTHLKGKRLENLLISVTAINEGLAAGGWVGRGSQKSTKGFGNGIPCIKGRGKDDDLDQALYMTFHYGQAFKVEVSDERLQAFSPKLALVALRAWLHICIEASAARTMLNALRPLPKVTAIGLSPKVTATFKEMGMDLDLPSIKPTEIATKWVHGKYPTTTKKWSDEHRARIRVPHPKAGELMFKKDGTPLMVPEYYLKWTPGTVMGCSRFSHSDCEACGKRIPSGRFVAIEADCKINGHIGLYLGCDCAKNIFGVKDAGLPRTPGTVSETDAD